MNGKARTSAGPLDGELTLAECCVVWPREAGAALLVQAFADRSPQVDRSGGPA